MNLVFPFPGILLGAKPVDKPLTGGVYSAELIEGFGEKLNKLKAKHRANSIGIMGVEPRGRGDRTILAECLLRSLTPMRRLN
jgi:hypothetical protein